jgi:hypothetical protein
VAASQVLLGLEGSQAPAPPLALRMWLLRWAVVVVLLVLSVRDRRWSAMLAQRALLLLVLELVLLALSAELVAPPEAEGPALARGQRRQCADTGRGCGDRHGWCQHTSAASRNAGGAVRSVLLAGRPFGGKGTCHALLRWCWGSSMGVAGVASQLPDGLAQPQPSVAGVAPPSQTMMMVMAVALFARERTKLAAFRSGASVRKGCDADWQRRLAVGWVVQRTASAWYKVGLPLVIWQLVVWTRH